MHSQTAQYRRMIWNGALSQLLRIQLKKPGVYSSYDCRSEPVLSSVTQMAVREFEKMETVTL